MWKNLKINNYFVFFIDGKVVIDDTDCSLTEAKSQAIIRYLVNEGFLNGGSFNVIIRRSNPVLK